MGSDIHSMAVFRYKTDEPWSSYGPATWKNPNYIDTKPVGAFNNPHTNQPFRVRYYALFSVLNDVRNYIGYDIVNPTMWSRGIPDDCLSAWKNRFPDASSNGYFHSHNYMTFDELDQIAYGDYGEDTESIYHCIMDALEPLRPMHDSGAEIRFLFAFDS